MLEYIHISNSYYDIIIPNIYKSFGEEVLLYSTNKIKEFLSFFKEEKYEQKIKAYFTTNREDFIKRIKKVSSPNTNLPPTWATGCFYGGEAQILLSEENLYQKFCTLTHETFHLLFSKFIYEKNHWDRIIWLDESLAGNFDGTTESLIKENKFQNISRKLLYIPLPKMNELSFNKGNIVTDLYNGYDLFKVVGRYLIETKTKEELFLYIHQKKDILKDGETILESALTYFKEKYKLTKT